MNWITNIVRPKFSSLLARKDLPANLWIKDPHSGEMVFHKDLEQNQWVVPSSGYHMKIGARARLTNFFDDGEFEEIKCPEVSLDPLKFRDERRYTERLKDNKAKTKLEDAVLVGVGKVEGIDMTSVVQDFTFMGGSLGMAAGEAIITGFETAIERKTPLILYAASGGARMQEGILSLMQLPRTTIAVQMLKEANLPYIVVLTNPTTGGVTASYAMLGDIHIAEPEALIGFAGPRVVEQTIREKMPEGFQRSEFLQEHGMVDMIVSRLDMRATIARIIRLLCKMPATEAPIEITEPNETDEDENQADAKDSDDAPSEVEQDDAQTSAPDETKTDS